MRSPFMTGFAEAIGALGVATLRFDFPYMRAGKRAPDRPPVLLDAWREAFAAAAERAGGRPVFAGGKSMGGRIASMAAAEGMPAAGLVFLGYPLHPPGRPDRLRDAHLDAVAVPMLFGVEGSCSGLVDRFATHRWSVGFAVRYLAGFSVVLLVCYPGLQLYNRLHFRGFCGRSRFLPLSVGRLRR
jgi:predicted alpha/beta-hydrolase family hydrolase